MIFIGLGNPGTKYQNTRHNVGFLAVERAAEKADIALKKGFGKKYRAAEGRYHEKKVIFVEPLTYMNKSGHILYPLMRKCQLDRTNLVVICDNLDLAPGECRVKMGGSSAGHNGLSSIIQYLGTNDFLRVYIGIGRPSYRSDVIPHVLGSPSGAEKKLIEDGIEKAAEAVLQLVDHPPQKVMNEFNRKNSL